MEGRDKWIRYFQNGKEEADTESGNLIRTGDNRYMRSSCNVYVWHNIVA